jgi:putative DNA primase/helicase
MTAWDPKVVTAVTALDVVHDASRFFDGATFIPSLLGEHLRRQWPIAVGGRQTYAFRDGAYRPSDDFLRHEITQLLGPAWKMRRADETISYLLQSSAALWKEPPTDRIAVANGILTLATRELTAADGKFLSPVQISARFDPHARCPAIDRFFAQVCPTDVPLLHELVGHLMVPENRQRVFMFLGGGGNGKTALVNLLIAFLGHDNISAISLHALEEERFKVAGLYGKLANIFDDLDARALHSTGTFKAITGGIATIEAERKHQQPFQFKPYARLVFSANEPPPTGDSSQGFFDRWVIVPFDQRIRGAAAERKMDELLAELTTPAELSGLLNHALDGRERLERNGGFTISTKTKRAGEDFRITSDTVTGFVHERCDIALHAEAPRAVLYSSYKDWCETNNRRALAAQRFHPRLRSLIEDQVGEPPGEKIVHGVRMYEGVELKAWDA